MLRSMVLVASTALVATTLGLGTASAQGVEIYTGPAPYYYDGYGAPPAPGYYGYEPGVVVRGPVRRGSCGQYRYWNGATCVDARVLPPNVD